MNECISIESDYSQENRTSSLTLQWLNLLIKHSTYTKLPGILFSFCTIDLDHNVMFYCRELSYKHITITHYPSYKPHIHPQNSGNNSKDPEGTEGGRSQLKTVTSSGNAGRASQENPAIILWALITHQIKYGNSAQNIHHIGLEENTLDAKRSLQLYYATIHAHPQDNSWNLLKGIEQMLSSKCLSFTTETRIISQELKRTTATLW